MNILFTKKQNEIYRNQIDEYKEAIDTWKIFYIIIPILIVLIPTLLFAFLPEDRINLQTLILNGSFSLLGINLLFGMSIYLTNIIKQKNENEEEEIIKLKTRLLIYSLTLMLLGTCLYLLQIAFNIDTSERNITILIGCFSILFLSINIAKRIYLLKDNFIGKPINEDIDDSIDNLTSAVDDLE